LTFLKFSPQQIFLRLRGLVFAFIVARKVETKRRTRNEPLIRYDINGSVFRQYREKWLKAQVMSRRDRAYHVFYLWDNKDFRWPIFQCFRQYSGSVTFWYGPVLDPASDPDPALYDSYFQACQRKLFVYQFFLLFTHCL
jgi:hypothetical protein